jgi:Rad3-related DNA helicase
VSTEEISEFEAAKIERHRKKMVALKELMRQRSLKRKRICAVEEKIPLVKLDQLLKDFKYALTERIDNTKMKVNNQRTTGLKEEEKDQLKRIVSKRSSKNLNNPYKRTVFAKNIIRSIALASAIRENWEYGDSDGPRDLKVLDSKFPSLIGLSWKNYIKWLNAIETRKNRLPIQIRERRNKQRSK